MTFKNGFLNTIKTNIYHLFVLFFLGTILLSLSSCDFSFFLSENNNNSYPSFSEVRYRQGYHDLKASGDVSILVIPVAFSDCKLKDEELNNTLDKIKKGFFGSSEDTYWESLSSFYEKSSYGKLHIKGEVSEVYRYEKTVAQTAKMLDYTEPTYDILSSALKDYENKGGSLSKFDLNNDNYIDGIWLIYLEHNYTNYQTRPSIRPSNNENIENLLWAYTYWYLDDINTKVKPFTYAWASYDFFDEAKKEKADAHTIIHETGHMLGLDDYYNYDFSTSPKGDQTKPAGSLDMMDSNILDHNAYSKFLLGWVNPRIIDRSGTYELASFQKEGECFIIPSSTFHNSPCDEYLILEYYTPDGLNYQDSKEQYASIYPLGFSEAGFKIYHVDSRLGLFKASNSDFVKYYEGEDNYEQRYFLQVAHSNTPSYSVDKNNRLLSLLSPLGESRKYFIGSASVAAENKDLFQKGDELNSYNFNGSGKKEFSLKITSSDEQKGTFQISL